MFDESLRKVITLLFGICGLIALLLSYLYPFHLPPWLTFYNEWLFAISVGFGVAWIVMHGRMRLVNGFPWIVALVLIILHAFFLGLKSPMQVTLLIFYLIFVLVGWLSYCVGVNFDGKSWLSGVLAVLFFAAFLSAVIAILQWSGVVAKSEWSAAYVLLGDGGGRSASNIGQANNLGTLLVIGVGVLGYAWYSRWLNNGALRLLGAVFLLVLLFGVYCSGSRAAVVNLILWPIFLLVLTRRGEQCFPWMVLLPILILGFLYLMMPVFLGWIGQFSAIDVRSVAADNNRVRLWVMVLSAIGRQPLFGHGLGSVANIHLNMAPEYGAFDYTVAHHAHNTVLDMWVTFGIPLGSVMVFGVLWLWIRAWVECRNAAQSFMWLMATSILVHALLEFPMHYGFFFWLFFFLLGAIDGKGLSVLKFERVLSVSVLWFIVYVACAISVWSAYVKVESFYTGYRQIGARATHQALGSVSSSLAYRLFYEPNERLFWLTSTMDEITGLSDAQLDSLVKVASYYPLANLGWRVSFAQAARGNADQAVWWAERMCRMFDPRICAAAADEWQRRGAGQSNWPVLPWEKWLPDNAVRR